MNIFEHEYGKILSEINTSPYLHQLERIKSVSANRPVILYGAGKAVGIVLVVCMKSGLEISALCDSNKHGMYEKGGVSLPVISPSELVANYSDSTLIVTSWKFENEIREHLKSIGFNSNNIFSFWYSQRITPEIFEENYLNGYKWAYNFYEDEISRQLVLDKISSYLNSAPLKPNTTHEIYYEEAIKLAANEVFLDGGAYDGDSIKSFIKNSNGKFKYIYGYEPDDEPFAELKEYTRGSDNIEIFNAGLGEKNDVKTFHYDGLVASGFAPLKFFATSGDKFSDTIFKTVDKNVFSIDAMIKDGKLKHMPTFIKLDVEGSETGTLQGAANLIRDYRPIFSISAYHRVQDIYEIPKTLLGIRPDYKFILRQHDFGYYETVLYAY